MPITATALLRFWDMACSLVWRPLPDSSLAGQEHGRTIPLGDVLEAKRSGHRFYHPCFFIRLGATSGGKETQGWRDSSHTAMVGAGKFGSAKLPMATATYPGKPSLSQ
jgi:hypothetical protein